MLAGCGFLTRYAGAGLILTGAVIVGVASVRHDRRLAAHHLGRYGAAALGTSAVWMARNVWTTGEPLGPRFSGGAHESVRTLTRRTILSVGRLVDDRSTTTVTAVVGIAAVAVVAVATIVVVRRRPLRTTDVGVLAFAWSSLIIPIVARVATASDISPRVMSPLLVPLVYLGVVAVQRAHPWRPAVLAGVVLAGWSMYQGVTAARQLPNAVIEADQARVQAAPELYRLIADLPPTATVLTNNPHSVWWLTGREPTLFGFTRPRAGNSHYPLSADRHVDLRLPRAYVPGLVRAARQRRQGSGRATTGPHRDRPPHRRAAGARRCALPSRCPRRRALPASVIPLSRRRSDRGRRAARPVTRRAVAARHPALTKVQVTWGVS